MKCPKCDTNNPADSRYCKECATSLTGDGAAQPSFTMTLETPINGLSRGAVFAGRYEVIEELGAGGMGEVYRVYDTQIKEEVALKLLKPEIAADKKTIERFRGEIRLARKIAQRSVCRMFDLGEYEGTHYITMEYVAGEDLKSLISRIGQMPTGKTLDIGRQICDGLSEAHRLGIVHRDLKPGNIMIDKQGNAKIMDFGIARSTETAKVTGTGVIIGTPEYMSPEQAEAEDIDPRSDIYSLGIILYEMVTGQVPFTGKSGLSVAMKQKGEQPKVPQEINPQVPDELSSLILKCLEKEREQRYETSEALKQKLDELARLLPSTRTKISRKKAHASREVTVTISPRRLLIPVMAVILFAIIILFIWKPWAPSRLVPTPEGRPSLAILPFTNNTAETDLDKYQTILADALQFHLDQSKYLHVISKERLLTVFERLNLDNNKDFSSEDVDKLISHGIGNHILTAQYFKSGEAFRINYKIREVSQDKVVFQDSLEGQGEDSLIPLVDTMSTRIKKHLNITETSDEVDQAYGEIRTKSLEAFRYYIEGTSLYTHGKVEEALPLLEKAIELDPEMALAYRQIGAYYSNKGERRKGKEYIEKALEFADRMPERHRLIIQAGYEWSFGGPEGKKKTLDLTTKLLQDYPDDLIGNRLLALTYRDLGEIDKAIEQGEKVIKLWPESPGEVKNMIHVYIPSLEFEKGCELFERALESFPEDYYIKQDLLLFYLYAGKLELALNHLNKYSSDFESEAPGFAMKARGFIFQLQGNFQMAEEEYFALSREKNVRHRDDGKQLLAHLKIQQGKLAVAEIILDECVKSANQRGDAIYVVKSLWHLGKMYLGINEPEKALKAFENILDLPSISRTSMDIYKAGTLIFKGNAHLMQNAVAEAQETAEELSRHMETITWRGGKAAWHRHLLGLISVKQGDFDTAIEHYNNSTANWILINPMTIPTYYQTFQEPLAQAFYKKGDKKKALEEYEKMSSPSVLRIGWGDVYARSLFMQGKIHAELGNEEAAVKNYQKFIDLWKDCDPELQPMVEDARQRLAGLQQN